MHDNKRTGYDKTVRNPRPRTLKRKNLFLTSFKKWREEILLHEAEPTVFADLGYGVLDSAMVETAAYCLVKCS